VTGTRAGKGGACEDRVTGSMVVAVVTHVAVMNLTFDPVEKRWKGLQPSGFFRHEAFLGEVCNNALARRMIEGGYRAESLRGAGFRLAGIPAPLRETFSKRRRRILERAKEVRPAPHSRPRRASVRGPGAAEHQRGTSLAGHQHRMIELGGGVFDARLDVARLKVGVIRENFRFGDTGRHEIEHVLHADAHPPNARPTAALVRVERDALRVVHPTCLAASRPVRKARIRSCKPGSPARDGVYPISRLINESE
jgi:hypothetical protein